MSSGSVLLVDENPIVRRLVRLSLLAQGFQVQEAANGADALVSADDRTPDLVLQSLILPDMDGCTLAAQLRAMPESSQLPIVALAAHASQLDDARRGGIRFDDFLFKPVEPGNLVRTVQALLAGGVRAAARPCAGRRVLAVDDNAVQLRLLRLVLTQLGAEVSTAACAAEALTALRVGDFHAVVSDVMMPDMDGFAFCLELRLDPRLARLPVVLVSSNHFDELDRGLAGKVGADAVVNRDKGTRAIADALLTALGRSARPAQVERDRFAVDHQRVGQNQLKRLTEANADLAMQCSAQAATLAVVGALSEVMTNELDLDARLATALSRCLDAAGLDAGAIYLVDTADPAGPLVPRAAVGLGLAGEGELWERFLGHPELFQRVMRTRSPLALPSSELPDALSHELLARLGGARSAILAPLVCMQGAMGVMVLSARDVELGVHWVGFAQAVSVQLAQGITLSRSFRRISTSETRYRSLMDQANDGVVVTDLTGKLVEVNQRAVELFGRARAELLGKRLHELVEPSQVARVTLELEALLRAGSQHCYALPLARPDRRTVIVDLSAARVELPESPCFLATLRDVTARLEQDQALARARQEFRQMIEAAPDGVLIRRKDKLVYVNPACAKALQHASPGSLIGRSLYDLVLPEDHAIVKARIAASNAGQAPLNAITVRVLTGGGEVATWELSAPQPIQFEGEPASLLIGRDLTERTKLQAQLMVSDRLASVGTLAAGVAHEMNNPLASVLANLELAMKEVGELRRLAGGGHDDLFEELSDARDSAERLRNVVRDLKLFSRAEEVTSGPCDVRRVMDSSLRMAWNEIRHRARLVKDYGRTVAVEANDSRLGQVFLNLIVNAAQALPEGQSDLHEIRVRTEMDQGMVLVEISDTGPGIPPEVQKRLFTPFFTTKPVGVGTGLGLSICQRLLTGMGGRIEIISPPGGGALARIWLAAAELERRPDAAALPPMVCTTRRGRVLVIDDEPMIASVVRRALAHNHDVTTETSAQSALERLRAGEQYDVILCDLMMPHMSGMDFHQELALLLPDQAARIIFMTGGAFTPRARNFLDGVANQRLDKPFDNQSLRAMVAERVG